MYVWIHIHTTSLWLTIHMYLCLDVPLVHTLLHGGSLGAFIAALSFVRLALEKVMKSTVGYPHTLLLRLLLSQSVLHIVVTRVISWRQTSAFVTSLLSMADTSKPNSHASHGARSSPLPCLCFSSHQMQEAAEISSYCLNISPSALLGPLLSCTVLDWALPRVFSCCLLPLPKLAWYTQAELIEYRPAGMMSYVTGKPWCQWKFRFSCAKSHTQFQDSSRRPLEQEPCLQHCMMSLWTQAPPG